MLGACDTMCTIRGYLYERLLCNFKLRLHINGFFQLHSELSATLKHVWKIDELIVI